MLLTLPALSIVLWTLFWLNSLTMNALWLQPIWYRHRHYAWQAMLAFILLYPELFSRFEFWGVNLGCVSSFMRCMCISTSFIHLWLLDEISFWNLLQKDIPVMFVDFFQIIPNFLYVCKSASWLTSLLKLGSYRDISSSVGDISLNFFGGFPGMFVY